MVAILKKELRLFFGSAIGYFVIASFLTLNGLLLWGFNNEFNILDTGFADLKNFFTLTPWLFLILIPALTMRSFSDEYKSGTIEILKTKPISTIGLIAGKFLSILILIAITLALTFTYTYTIYELATPVGKIDLGSIATSYIGLLFLASTFTAIGLLISTVSKNQLIILIQSIVLSFFIFYGIQSLGDFFPQNSYEIELLGMYAHFQSIGRGVIDSRDLIYFISCTLLFLTGTLYRLEKQKNYKKPLYVLAIILIINILSYNNYSRIDFTNDKRYTLAEQTVGILDKINQNLVVKIYLEGNFPPEFKRLQVEALEFLDELKAKNKNLKVLLIDPKHNLQQLVKAGLTPSRLTVEENGVISEAVILPWATIQYKNKTENISLLKDSNTSESQQQQLENSIQNLEYSFAKAIQKISSKKEKSIAVLSGNGELGDIYLYSFLKTLGEYYHLAKFTLDSTKHSPNKTLQQLKNYDLAIIAKPTKIFSEKEKYLLDQFTLNGGKSLWLVDPVIAHNDSLFNNGKMLAFPRNLNLDDFFFRYGIRLNPDLVKDLYASKIALATGNSGNKTTFDNFLWFYHPLVTPTNTHPITNNVGPVNLQFASSIDTLKNGIKKTVLLKSSILSKRIKTPNFIELSSISTPADPRVYKEGNQTLGVLLEGEFTSAYKDRLKPFDTKLPLEKGTETKMVVLSDGDIASNQIHQRKPLELGVDKWTQQFYSNKEFLINTVNYLLDDTGLIKVRSKKIELYALDRTKTAKDRLFWQLLNIVIPLLILFVLSALVNYIRKKKYQ